jgi:myo-inositol-1(or 4)-monophosphatase
MRNLLDLAVKAALAGAEVISARVNDMGTVRVKSTQVDVVTDVDIAAGVAVAKTILRQLPDAGFVIEEEEVHALATAPRGTLTDAEVWVIDPLDGTTSFLHGFPCYSVSVAVLRNGVPIAGAVHNVPAQETIAAAAGLGATKNGAPIQCNDTAQLTQALLMSGFPYDRGATLDRQLATLAAFMRTPIHGMRRDGSAAVDCTHVACGRADGFWEYSLRPWDTAAGVVILRESGARVTDTNGEPWSTNATGIVAANPALHAQMLDVIRTIGA